jgi:hypothetical protein
MTKLRHLDYLRDIALQDAQITVVTDFDYQGSWKSRGGSGAFHMLARKWDRIEAACTRNKQAPFDIFATAAKDEREEGIIDDIRDLRRYLMLVEAELRRNAWGAAVTLTARDQEALKRFKESFSFEPNGRVMFHPYQEGTGFLVDDGGMGKEKSVLHEHDPADYIVNGPARLDDERSIHQRRVLTRRNPELYFARLTQPNRRGVRGEVSGLCSQYGRRIAAHDRRMGNAPTKRD